MTDKEALDKALELALEALEKIVDAVYVNSQQEAKAVCKANDAITAIKQARAAPVREDWGPGPHEYHSLPPAAQPAQEPVAWVTAEDVKLFGTGQGESAFLFKKKGKWNAPLYTTPPAQLAPVPDLPFGVGGGLVAIKTLLSRDPCVHANTAIQMIDAILATPPAAPVQDKCFMCGERVESCMSTACPKTITAIKQARSAPVQEPVAWLYKDDWGRAKIAFSKETANEWGAEVQPLYTTPPNVATPPAKQRQGVDLPDEEIKILWVQYRAALPRYLCFAKALLQRSKEKNT